MSTNPSRAIDPVEFWPTWTVTSQGFTHKRNPRWLLVCDLFVLRMVLFEHGSNLFLAPSCHGENGLISDLRPSAFMICRTCRKPTPYPCGMLRQADGEDTETFEAWSRVHFDGLVAAVVAQDLQQTILKVEAGSTASESS